jgi:tetratricopeptide (TPR) repeat protein
MASPGRRGLHLNVKLPSLLILLACAVAPLRAREPVWTRLEAPNFTIISALPESETRDWAVEFDQFHQGLRLVLHLNEGVLQPVTVLLFRDDSDMRSYLPLEKGKPAEMAGLFTRSPLGNFIEAADGYADEQTRHLIFHEGVHWLTDVSDPPLPLWLDEGLAEVFSTFRATGDHYQYGNVIESHVLLLNRERMLPLKQLLAIRHGSLLYNEGKRTSIFYAESWAFVHYLLFSGSLEERTKYNQMLRLLPTGLDPDTLFKQVFGVDCAGMDGRLEAYLQHGRYTIVQERFDRARANQSFKIRKATAAEVELAKCSLLTAVGRPAEALPRLRRWVAEATTSPAGWEAAGFAAWQLQDYEETEASFRHAAALGSRNYFVYSYLGDATLGIHPGGMRPAAGGDPRLAFDLYEHELSLNPRDQHAYDNCAGNSYNLDTYTQLDVRFLLQGARLFPDDQMIRFGLAVIDLKQGRTEPATAALRKIAADPLPGNQDAAASAQFVLAEHQRITAFEHLTDLWQKQDYAGVIAQADAMLASPLTEFDRQNVSATRERAAVALKVQHAVELANAGELPEAKRLLGEAKAQSNDEQMMAQIEGLIERMNSNSGNAGR